MKPTFALVLKECRQHAWFLLAAVLLLVPIELMLLAIVAADPNTLSQFESHRRALIVFIPLFGLVLGNRLVVSEYYGRTQVFLESLPIPRSRPVLVKLGLGASLMLLVSLTLFACSAVVAAFNEPLSAEFMALMLARSTTYTLFVFMFFFAMGFVGRFRMAIYMLLFFGMLVATEISDFRLDEIGPIQLIDATYPFERNVWPWSDLAITWGLTLALLGAALGLPLLSEGSLAEGLAKPMTAREKSAVGAVALAGLMALSGLERNEPDPYTFASDTPVAQSSGGRLQIAYATAEQAEAAATLQNAIEPDLLQLAPYFGWTNLPIARVSLSESLGPRTFEPVIIAKNDGALVRANFAVENFDLPAFRSVLFQEIIAAKTAGRARFETYAWFHEGLAEQLARGGVDVRIDETERRAVYAAHLLPVSEENFSEWFRTRERLGPDLARALAASAVRELAEQVGGEAVQQLAQRLFGRTYGNHTGVSVGNLIAPFSAIFEDESGLSLSTFLQTFHDQLVERAPEIEGVGSFAAELTIEPVRGQLRALRAAVQRDGTAPQATVVALLHLPMGVEDELVSELSLERSETELAGGETDAEITLIGRYSETERAFVAIEVESASLGCPIRLHAERLTLP